MCCLLIAAEAKQDKKVLDKSAPAYQPAFLLDTARDWCEGSVKELTKTSITIEPIPFSSGGTGLRTYELSPRLASGDYPRDYIHAMFKAADVKLGDRVDITYHRKMGRETCDIILIKRRPGGKVPKSRYTGDWGKHVPHEMFQAFQDWEEKGIPIPQKYLGPTPEEIRKFREWEDFRRSRRTAPMPREVKR